MSKISCKMRNSFAIDNQGKLYSWGNWENGLLGNDAEADILKPNELDIYDGRDLYYAEQVSSSHFHVAIVANRADSALPKELKYAQNIFKRLHTWYQDYFIPNITNPISLIKVIMRRSEMTKDNIKYPDEFEKFFLKPFFAFQKLNNNDIFKMNKVYQDIFAEEYGLSSKKLTFPPSELNKLIDTATPELREVANFALYCVNHFKKNPEDFPFFVKFVVRFEEFVTQQDIITLFEYCYQGEGMEPNNTIEFEIKSKITQIFNELKRMTRDGKKEDYLVSTNELIDNILHKQTGIGVVFTWGVYAESRLGYNINKEYSTPGETKATENDLGDKIYIQRFPKMVIFKNIFTKILKIACGYSHTLALSEQHRVYSWGSGKYGCLGNSKSDNVDQPELIEKDFEKNVFNEISDIAAGMYFSMALENDGKVYSWGCGNNGRLGHGDENSVGHPKVINLFLYHDIKIKQFACGDTHAAALSTSKALFTWGNGGFGKLGHGNFDDVKSPLQVEFFNSKKADLVICGSQNTMVVLTDFRIFAWGKNSHGMLGIPNFVDQNILIPAEVIMQKEGQENVQLSEIAMGTMHTMFLFSNGSLHTCGNTVNGILAQEDVFDKLPVPKKVNHFKFFETPRKNIFIDSIFKIYNSEFSLLIPKTKYAVALSYAACSNYNSAFVTNNGELYMSGETSLVCREDEKTATSIEQTPETTVGEPTSKGKGMIKSTVWSDKLVKMTHPVLSEKVTYIALGKHHVICVADKKAYSWGKNLFGMLGLSNKAVGEAISQPALIEKIASAVKMAAVSDSHSFVLTCNGEVYGFGSNLYGKLGLGEVGKYFEYSETLDHPVELEPKLVKNITYAEYIACSNSHSACIMKYDNKFAPSYMVYTWGSGFLGKLGHYDGGDAYEPKKVEELDKFVGNHKLFFVKLALGDEFTLALDITGSLWGWGKKKYLGIFKDSNEVDEGIISTPDSIYPGIKFKFISSSNNYVMAIDVEGNLYSWGKINKQGKNIFHTIEKISCDKMDFIACGTNHFIAIEGKTNIPFSWGSNLFYKCGQNFARGQKKVSMEVEDESFYSNPRKLEYFFDYFIKNSSILEAEKENVLKIEMLLNSGEESNKETAGYHKSNPVQLAILDERMEYKNIGLLSEDFKINQNFYEALEEYFRQTKAIEAARMKEVIKIENQIIYAINKANTLKNAEYRSEVPKIISQNFQIYELFLSLLQIHPCYLQKVYSILPNKIAFIDVVKMVFGRNFINMRNKRVILMLMGLWNSLFRQETKENSNSLKDTDRYEDYVTYDLYDLIFKINKENMNIVYDITCEIFLYFITQILDKSDVTNPSKDQDVLSHYKDMGELKKDFCTGAIKIIANRIKYLFSEMKENLKNNFTFSVVWMFKRISKLYKVSKRDKDSDMEKNMDQSFFRLFNYFLFVPFIDLLKKIRDSYDETQCAEYTNIVKKFPEVLEKIKTKSGFAQLFNLHKSSKIQVENSFFKNICSPKSDILRQVYELFIGLAQYEHGGINEMITQKASEEIEKMNYTCKESLRNYQYDFTLTTFKELIKSNSENGNEGVFVPLTVRDLVQLQTYFLKLLNTNSDEKQLESGPLRDVLNIINDFKLEELDNNSSIQNFVLNFYIKPNSFFYIDSDDLGEPKIIKCQSCMLPVHHVFFEKQYVKEYIEGKNWVCECGFENERNVVVCGNKRNNCNLLKSEKVIKQKKSFFKQFKIPYDDEFTLLFEEVLFIMHPISDRDDILKEIEIALDRFRAQKNKEKTKLKTLLKFKNLFNNKLGNPDDMQISENDKNMLVKMLYQSVDSNIKKRAKHLIYLNNIKDFIGFLGATAENSKANFNHNEKQNLGYLFNVGRGYSNEFTKEIGPLTKILGNKSYDTMKNNDIKKYLVGGLIKSKVIDEILFQQSEQPKLKQKSYILFEKEPAGYRIKLNYKEKFRKFIICGVNTHEYVLENKFISNEEILEMRRRARNNPTFNLEEIRFNIFYLIKLLNSLETD